MNDAPVLHRGIGAPTKCKSCPAMIVFAKTTGGKLAPFVADPNGLWTIVNGEARYLGKATPQLVLGEEPPPRFTNHFSDCPAAQSHRRNRD